MAHGGPSSGVASPAPANVPRATASASVAGSAEQAQSKRDLTSWWSKFTSKNHKLDEQRGPPGIFGIPLDQSIRYANVAISLFDDNGQSYIYGYVPIVVAKCGVFLKEKATEIEGIFRLAGSERRIKELKVAFDSPDRYGKGLDWSGYTVHDAANILRRYLNQLPEPIIPLDFYNRFRDPLRNHQQQAVGQQEAQTPDKGHFDAEGAIRAYQALITELPPLNRQLLLYLLDLLAVFASKSDLNKMTTPNLAAIFQPGILSHPQHDMAPQEYRLSQDVLIFLIENQDSFLIGMNGTAADEQTVRDVQSGYQPQSQTGSPTSAPGRSKTVIGRTSSSASGGTEGRRFSGIRRNVSTSSRTSRQSSTHGGTASPGVGSPTVGSGVHRSNTVPSQRHGGASPRFVVREKSSGSGAAGQQSPQPLQTVVPGGEQQQKTPIAATEAAILLQPKAPAPPDVTSASSSEATTPLAAPHSATSSAGLLGGKSAEPTAPSRLLSPDVIRRDGSRERTASPSHGSRGLLDKLRKSAGGDGEKKEQRQGRKLQKKRAPGSTLSSAHSSADHLGEGPPDEADEGVASPVTPQYRDTDPLNDMQIPGQTPQRPEAVSVHTGQSTLTDLPVPRPFAEGQRTHSPGRSVQSLTSTTDFSDGESAMDEGGAGGSAEKPERKRRWRFSHSAKSKHASDAGDANKPVVSSSLSSVPGSVDDGRRRSSSAAVAMAQQAHPATLSEDNFPPGSSGASPPDTSGVLSDSEEKKKGPMSWIKGKIQERKEKEAEKRARSPTGQQASPVDRPKSVERPQVIPTAVVTESTPVSSPATAAPTATATHSTATTGEQTNAPDSDVQIGQAS